MIKSRFLQKTLAVSSVCVMAFLMILAPVNSVYAAMSETQLYENAQNGVYFYDACSGGRSSSRISSDSCYKVDGTVSANQFWYAEGCLNNGDCTSGKYYANSSAPAGQDNGLIVTKNNPFIYNDTMTDDNFGGMQYIYAENYDYSYNGAYTKMTPNGGNSDRKYYWIVLPDQAYTNGFGDTYVATFENMSEPVYFIVFDAHACPHQSEDYCGKARENPDAVEIGKQFFGAFTKNGGNYTSAANIAGRLTSICRINGSGEVLVSENTNNAPQGSEVAAIKTDVSNPCSKGGISYDGHISADGLTADLAWKIAHYYNSGANYKAIAKYGLKNCVEFSNFFVSNLTARGTPGKWALGSSNGGGVASDLMAKGIPGGREPQAWSVFSTGGHTGVVVGANDDGTFVTVEAAYPGWKDSFAEGAGNARVYSNKNLRTGTYTFAYFGDTLNTAKLSEILGE